MKVCSCMVVYSGVWLNVGACLVQNDDGSLQTKVQTSVQKATSPNLRQTAVQKVCSFTVVCGGVWWCVVVVYSGVWLNVGACLVQNDDGSLQTKVQTPVQIATSPNLRQTAVRLQNELVESAFPLSMLPKAAPQTNVVWRQVSHLPRTTPYPTYCRAAPAKDCPTVKKSRKVCSCLVV